MALSNPVSRLFCLLCVFLIRGKSLVQSKSMVRGRNAIIVQDGDERALATQSCQMSLFGRYIGGESCLEANRSDRTYWKPILPRFRSSRRMMRMNKRMMMMMLSRRMGMSGQGGLFCRGIDCVPRKRPAPQESDCYSFAPTIGITEEPTRSPSASPIQPPTGRPTRGPTGEPTRSSTTAPTRGTTARPSQTPTAPPTGSTNPSPTTVPTSRPTGAPTGPPRILTPAPSQIPSAAPTPLPRQTPAPTRAPTRAPTASPSRTPSAEPSPSPTPLSRSGPTIICCVDATGNCYGDYEGLVVPQDTNQYELFNVSITYTANGVRLASSDDCGNSNPDIIPNLVIQEGELSWTQIMDYGTNIAGFCGSRIDMSLIEGVAFWQLVGLDQGRRVLLGQLNFTCLAGC